MQANSTHVELSSDASSSISSDDDASTTESTYQDVEIIESEQDELDSDTPAMSPPPRPLPLIEVVIELKGSRGMQL